MKHDYGRKILRIFQQRKKKCVEEESGYDRYVSIWCLFCFDFPLYEYIMFTSMRLQSEKGKCKTFPLGEPNCKSVLPRKYFDNTKNFCIFLGNHSYGRGNPLSHQTFNASVTVTHWVSLLTVSRRWCWLDVLRFFLHVGFSEKIRLLFSIHFKNQFWWNKSSRFFSCWHII